MKQAAFREEMQRIDACNINELGIPGLVLMERAALSMADVIRERFPEGSSLVVVAEKGNNGGDGLALARILGEAGFAVSVYEIGAVPRPTDSYVCQKEILKNLGVPFLDGLPRQDPEIWVDAIFGVGLNRDVTGIHRQVLEKINARSGCRIAVDIPSGVNASDGRIMGVAFQADLTITFGLHKVGLLLYPGAGKAGEVIVTDIGFTWESVKRYPPGAVYYERKDLACLPQRKAWSNKGSYGKVLLVAGSRNMAGAAVLAGRAAYRAGCGLVRIMTPECNRLIIQQALPDAILTTWEDEESLLKNLKEALSWAEVIGIGPGLSTGDDAFLLVREVLSKASVPLVIDADGLNVLSVILEDAGGRALYENYHPGMILTPHPMEMSRLRKEPIGEILDHMAQTASDMADRTHTVVLKDARTLVACGDEPLYINVSGNHGMAVAGSGDVLTGTICGLLAQGASMADAARLGVYCHGLAGDLAAAAMGSRGLMAADLADYIGKVTGEAN
ncbi:MAG: NAD(P)H-hydrate dehydratase [Eubacterium sp.]|nr:NAD(P)H-hydrate dehydratase [Eubacterium sp.]